MHITCVICGDLFTGVCVEESVYATPCGHLFHHNCLLEWLGRSRSCPQCRHKTSESKIIRIFFNLANTNDNDDASLLKFKIDGLEYKVEQKEREIKLLEAERDKCIRQTKGLRQEVIDAYNKEKKSEQAIYSLKNEVTLLKQSCRAYSASSLENEALKKEIATLKKMQDIINGTDSEVEAALQDADSYPDLGRCVTYFKKRIKSLQSEHKIVQSELMNRKKKINFLESELSLAQEAISELRDQNKNLDTITSVYTGKKSNFSVSPMKKMKIDSIDSSDDRENRRQLENSDDEEDPQSSRTETLYKKPSFAYIPKSISLQSNHKIQHTFRLPLKQSKSMSTSAGDDNFHPQKYQLPKLSSDSKITKKPKKKLSPSAVSALKVGNKADPSNRRMDSFFNTVDLTSSPSSAGSRKTKQPNSVDLTL